MSVIEIFANCALRGSHRCRVQQRGKVCANRIGNGTNQGNGEQEKAPDIRRTQNAPRAKTGETTPYVALSRDCQVAKCKPYCWQNPCPLRRRISPSSPHAEPDKSRTNDAEGEFLRDYCRDRVRRNHSPQRGIQNRRSDYCNSEVNQQQATEL
jgi:hypothetical protein